METLEQLKEKSWWGYLGEDLQKLLGTSEFIYRVVEGWGVDLPGGREKFGNPMGCKKRPSCYCRPAVTGPACGPGCRV